MTQPGGVTPDSDQLPEPVAVRRVLLATLAPAAATTSVIVAGTLVLRAQARGLDGTDRGGGVLLVVIGLLVLALAALTAAVSAAVLFGFLLSRGTRLRAVGGWLAACLLVALLSTRGLLPALVAVPLLTLVPLTVLGRLRWWWSAGPAALALAVAVSPLAAG